MSTLTPTRSVSQRQIAVRLASYLALALAIGVCFGRTLAHDFVAWDDNTLIYSNPNVTPPTASGLARSWDVRDPDHLAMYDPMVMTLWWALAHTDPLAAPSLLGTTLNPLPYHLANLVVHFLAACLVLEILRRLGISTGAALLGALVFAVHPIQTEAVAWATGMKDLLCGAFVMASILCYLRAAQSPNPARFWPYALAIAFCIAAMLSKPAAVVLPLIVLMLDTLLLRRSWRTALLWTAPMLALAGATAVLAKLIQPAVDIVPSPLWAKPLIAADCLAFYLVKLAYPAHLAFVYARTPSAVLHDPVLGHPLYWSWALPLVATLIIWKSRERMLQAAGWLFALGVLPVLGLFAFQFQFHSSVADRYAYISMLGVALAIGWAVMKWNRQGVGIVASAAVLACAGLSYAQTAVWQDTQTLFEHGLALHPVVSPMHYLVLGQYYDKQSQAAAERGQPDRQRACIDKAIGAYRTALSLDAAFAQVYRNLTVDLELEGRWQEAIDVTRQRMNIQPMLDPAVRDNPAALHATLGALYLRSGDAPAAVRELSESLKLQPDDKVEALLKEAREKANSP